MRKISGLATAAVLATAVVGMQAGSATGQAVRSAEARDCCRRAPGPPGVARATTGQKFVVTDTIVDDNGATARAHGPPLPRPPRHRRRPRRPHRPERRLAGREPDPGRAACTWAPRRRWPTRPAARRSPAGATAKIKNLAPPPSRPWSSTPPGARRASPGRSSARDVAPTARPSRLSTYVDATTGKVIRTRGAHPDRRGLRPDPLQRDGPAAAHAVGLDVPAQGPDPRQHLHDRHEQRRGLDPLPDLRQRLQDRHRCSPARPTTFGNGTNEQPRVRRPPTRSTAPTSPGTTTRTCTAGTASSAPAPARSTGSTTATGTSTRSGTAPR